MPIFNTRDERYAAWLTVLAAMQEKRNDQPFFYITPGPNSYYYYGPYSGVQANEGEAMIFWVTRSGNTSSEDFVRLRLTAYGTSLGGGGADGSDAYLPYDTIYFAPGETTKQVAVQTISDELTEKSIEDGIYGGRELFAIELFETSRGAIVDTWYMSGSVAEGWRSYGYIADTSKTSLTLQSTTATSNQLILTFSEDIQIAGGGSLNPAYMTVIVDGQTRKVTRSQITGPDHPTIHTASQLVLTLSGRALDSAKSISVSYNPPSNTTSSGFITDLSDNRLASIATQIVDTFSTSTSINKSGIASAYKNLILTGSAPITGYGNAQNNTITGNDANNTLDGLAGADTMIGGLGDDTYVVDNVGDVITELASAGTDTVQSTIAYTLTNNLENLTLLGSGAINATGNTANNILTGNASANVLNGNGGTDTLIGGRGDDIYIVDSADDIIKETLISSDVDSVESSVSWVLGTNLENLTLTGTTTINGTGNELNNTIIGNSSDNILDGGNGGTDLLTGLGGADTFKFSTRPSSFRNSSADHITDFSSVQEDKIQITKSAFGINASTATLSVVNNAQALNTALSTASLFVYNSTNGELHWNQNGIIKGAGTGGVLAILDNKATLSAGDLVLV